MDANTSEFGHFWDLRPLRHYSERISFVLSLTTNTILAVLLMREKNVVMKPYSRVLLLNCLFDYIYTFACIVVEVELEMLDGNYIFVINGLPRDWSPESQAISVACWMFALSLTGFVPPIEFMFRYYLVVKKKLFNGKQILAMGAIVVAFSFADFFLLLSSFKVVPDQHAAFDVFMREPMWSDGGNLPAFVGADKNSAYFQLFVLNVAACDFAIAGILLVASVATLRKLEHTKHQMSAATKYMQSQMNRLMFAEAISLCFVVLIPFGVAMFMLQFRTKVVGFAMVLGILITWIPTVNPITTIFLVGPYRRAVFGKVFDGKRVYVDPRLSDAVELSMAPQSNAQP